MRKPCVYTFPPHKGYDDQPMTCSPHLLVSLLISQWKSLSPQDIEATQYCKRRIAKLIEQKYKIDSLLVENYLTNLERTLPLAA